MTAAATPTAPAPRPPPHGPPPPPLPCAAQVWWHIERTKRRHVILLLVGNIAFQLFLQIAAIVYYSYALDQSTAGTLLGLSMMLSSIGCAIAGAYYQSLYEQASHQPPPTSRRF